MRNSPGRVAKKQERIGRELTRVRPAKYQLPLTKYRSPYNHLRAELIFHDISGHGAGCHRIRTGQIHQAGAAASREIAILRADDHLIGAGGNSRPRVDAGAAAWFDHGRPGADKDIEVTLFNAVFPRLLRAKLNVE